MFTQAGICTVGARFVCAARVSRLGRGGVVWGWLMRFRRGDLAWGSHTQVCWPEQVYIHSYIESPALGLPAWPLDPNERAREWLELGVDRNASGFRASIQAASMRP
jgi:hypothetical protein